MHIRLAKPLSAEQAAVREAILDFAAGSRDVFGIGGAATGKSHLLTTVARDIPGIILAAPTNVAAARLRASTGLPASTLHHLLYRPEEVIEIVKGEPQTRLEWIPVAARDAFAGRIIAVDELSMVAAWIVDDLLDRGARILAVGDHYQLPPVNAAPFFTAGIIDIELSEIHRQGNNSGGIIRQAYNVLDGASYRNDGDEFRVVKKCGPYLRWADAVITLRNATRLAVNKRMRRMQGIAPTDLPYKGEPLVTAANDYASGIFNGEHYTVAADMQPGGPLLLRSPYGKTHEVEWPYIETLSPGKPEKWQTQFAFGHCMTAHRAQGSEWPRVLIVDELFGADQQSWRYTSITRAREAVVIGRAL